MTQRKKHVLLWSSLGLLFSLLVFLVVVTGLSGHVLVPDADGIPAAADTVLSCIQKGDWASLKQMVHGDFPLTLETGEADSAEGILWQAYLDSLQWTCADSFQVAGSSVTQSVTVTFLDLPAVARAIGTELDRAANSRPREQTLPEAARQVLRKNMPICEQQITLTFLREKGNWQLVPDRELLALLSGFTAH